MALGPFKTVLMYHGNGFEITASTIMAFYLLRFLLHKNNKDVLLFTIWLAIGVNIKYSVLFYYAPLCILLFYTNRDLVSKKYFKLCIGIFVALILPNFLWELSHDLLFLKYVSHIRENQTNTNKRLNILLSIIFSGGITSLLNILGFWKLFKSDKILKSFAYACLFSIGIVVIAKGKPIYCTNFTPILMCFGILQIHDFFVKERNRHIILCMITLLIIPQFLATSFVLPPKNLYNYCEFLRKKISKKLLTSSDDNIHNPKHILPQTQANMLGWNKMVDDIYSCYKNDTNAVIFCQNYGQAGAVEIIGRKYNLPKPISLHDNFYYWSTNLHNNNPTTLIVVSHNGYSANLKNGYQQIDICKPYEDDFSKEGFITVIYSFKKPMGNFYLYLNQIIPQVKNPSAAYVI